MTKTAPPEPTVETVSPRAWLMELLPKSAHKHIDKILEEFELPVVARVEVRSTHVAIERVEAYGLVIGLDAHGNASYVDFPYGAEITEEWC